MASFLKFDKKDPILFQKDKSRASCTFDEIRGIAFGGINSRFWLFRKHVNTLKDSTLANSKKVSMPFYAWQCISLQLEKRTIDLVVESEEQMINLIKVLVYKLNIIDGITSSSLRLQERIYHLELQKRSRDLRKSKSKKTIIGKNEKMRIRNEVKTMIYRKAVLKYRILIIRAKISYEAFKK